MNIEQSELDKHLLNILRKRYGDVMAENLRLEATQQLLVTKINQLETQLARHTVKAAKAVKKSNDGGTF